MSPSTAVRFDTFGAAHIFETIDLIANKRDLIEVCLEVSMDVPGTAEDLDSGTAVLDPHAHLSRRILVIFRQVWYSSQRNLHRQDDPHV